MEKVKIILADDHQMFLDGLAALLQQIEHLEIVATVNNGKQAIDTLAQKKCDLVIIDLHMPDMDGIATTRAVKKDYPQVKVLGLTMDNELESVRALLDAGASGYILKNTGRTELELAIDQVMKGENYLSSAVGNQLAQSLLLNKKKPEDNLLHQLTEREIEILAMIANENSNTEIAEKLFISPKTVETHRKNLMKKIDVHNSLGIYKFAVKHKLI